MAYPDPEEMIGGPGCLVWLSLFALSGLVAVVDSSLCHCFIWWKVVCCSESV